MILTTIREARLEDVEPMRDIERAAAAMFAEIGMDDVAEDEPLPRDVLTKYVQRRRAWIVEIDGKPAGYGLADEVDGCGHLEQVSIRPEYGRRGIGRTLIECVEAWARDEGFPAVTLSTFRDVPWNGPYYARLGFRTLNEDELTPGLRVLRAHEVDHGLDTTARQFMRLDVEGQPYGDPQSRLH
jgi:GNAT superfamily N-acetyltransferase